MNSFGFGEYNKDQWTTYQAIYRTLNSLPSTEVEYLKEMILPYLSFRKAVDDFQLQYFLPTCENRCFQNRVSTCCGFESIIMFFADHVINALSSCEETSSELLKLLAEPNHTERCIYLGPKGCIWKVRPISCAMFLCDQSKQEVFAWNPEIEAVWEKLKNWEKEFTWPIKAVLFDQLEKYFLKLGVISPHMYFHQSPGLLKVKARAGL